MIETSAEETYGLRQAQETIEGNAISGKFDALQFRDTKLVVLQLQASNVYVICDNIARDLPCAVDDTELSGFLDKRTRRLRSEEVVVSLCKKGFRM
jgi:hypothetical protein